jgi:hypothetical protein
MKWIIVTVVLLIFVVLFNPYGETRIFEGEKFGLSIGDSKTEVYKNLNKFLAGYKVGNDRIFMLIEVPPGSESYFSTEQGYGVFIEPQFHESVSSSFTSDDRWIFYRNANFKDVIELRFKNDKLTEIYRNKMLLEAI